jgi:hypothetical protein
MLGHLVYTGHDENEHYTLAGAGWLTRLMRAIFGKS